MRIGMVLEQRFPPDIRVEKEVLSLIKAGHEVFILCKPKKGFPTIETGKYGTIIRRKMTLINRLRGFLTNYFVNIHPFWLKGIYWLIQKYSINVIHIHDLPLVKTAIIASKGKIPVIADLHESFPPALQIWARSSLLKNNFIFKSILYNKRRWEQFERESTTLATKVITVVEESKNRIIERYSVPPEKIVVVSNTESKNSIFRNPLPINSKNWDFMKNRFIIVYVGGFGIHRGIDTAIHAVALLKSRIPEILLLIIGKGSFYITRQLQSIIEYYNISYNVSMPGYIMFQNVPPLVGACDVGIIPHNFDEHTDHTIPHKLSQFMLAKKPVLVSSCRPLKRVVNHYRAGLVFESNNPISLAKKIAILYNNPVMRKQYGVNAEKSVIEGDNNWETDSKNLNSLYENIENVLRKRISRN